eukprot:gene1403-1772_t
MLTTVVVIILNFMVRLSGVDIKDATNTSMNADKDNIKKRKLESSSTVSTPVEDLVKVNPIILENHAKLKKEYIEIIEIFSEIRGWILLNVPRIEDGNNFGVDIQEDVVGQLNKVEEVYTSNLEQSEQFFISRAGLVKKALKYKEIEDFKLAIMQIDEKEMIRYRFACFDLYNNYANSYSLIVKNFQKIETPRPNHVNSLF